MISGLTTTPIEFFHSHTNFFQELTKVDGTYSSDGFMGLTSYSLGPILCASSDVSRIVGIEIGLTTTPVECFHGHTYFFHKLTIITGA